jgi:ubiquinone/menaquinone biosynthesis C-methylase UbiE
MNFTILYRAHRILGAYKNIIPSGASVCDVGCGNGIVGAFLAEKIGCAVTGADILDYTNGRIPFRQMIREDTLPFSDGEFDIAMLNDMLHHMPYENQERILKEALRVAKTVLVFEVHPTYYAKFTDWLANKIHQPLMRISFTHRTEQQWLELFRRNGLNAQSQRITDAPPQHQDIGWRISALAYKPVINYRFIITKQ